MQASNREEEAERTAARPSTGNRPPPSLAHPSCRSAIFVLAVLASFIPQVEGFHGFFQPPPKMSMVAQESSLGLGRYLTRVGCSFQTRQRKTGSSLQNLKSAFRVDGDGPNDISYSTALVFALATVMTIAGFTSIENSDINNFIQEATNIVDHSLLFETNWPLHLHPQQPDTY